MELGYSGNKRSRGNAEELPEAKRLHADLFFGILEDDDIGGGERDPASQELENVMKSLEEEIGLLPATETGQDVGAGRQLEIGYLLEASDDELGLPPAEQSSPEEAKPAEGFGQIWGFEEDGMPGWYDGFSEFMSFPEKFDTAEDVGTLLTTSFDAGLFDLSEFYLRPGSLPAL